MLRVVHHQRSSLRVGAVLCGLLSLAPCLPSFMGMGLGIARASLLVPLDLQTLVSRSDKIVVGVVEGQTSLWADEDHKTIVTDVKIRVRAAMHGAKDGEIITVRRLGGAVDGIGMKVFGEANFQMGEEVLLFAERRGGDYFAVGMTQGKLRVTTEGNQKFTQMDTSGAEFLKQSTAQGPRKRLLSEMLREISALVSARKKQVKP